jgi:hypothetical protein
MNTTRELHKQAMGMADEAFIARREGLHEQAIQLFQDAYELEFEAARRTTKEPGRSVLHRSAATLALHGQLLREAEKVVALALTGDPPPEIANELREVFEKINFHRHLGLQGIELNPSEVQMSIVGNAISDGMALIDDVVVRVQNLEKLIARTAQRINKRPFGRMPKDSKGYSLFMSPPRQGSFAVTLRVGQPQQDMFPEMDDKEQVIDEMIFNLSLLNEYRIDELRNAIPEKQYFESFLGVAKSIAPDGDNVRMVGVTALRKGREVSVGFSVVSKDIKPVIDDITDIGKAEETRESVQIIGQLLIGDAIKNKIQVVDDNGKRHHIEVSEAIAEDVVKPYFGARVAVDAIRIGGKRLRFMDINSSEI